MKVQRKLISYVFLSLITDSHSSSPASLHSGSPSPTSELTVNLANKDCPTPDRDSLHIDMVACEEVPISKGQWCSQVMHLGVLFYDIEFYFFNGMQPVPKVVAVWDIWSSSTHTPFRDSLQIVAKIVLISLNDGIFRLAFDLNLFTSQHNWQQRWPSG